jgi:hypothetical protein
MVIAAVRRKGIRICSSHIGYTTRKIIFTSVIVDNKLMTNDPSDMICEKTRYSLVRNDAMYALMTVMTSVEEGKRKSHGIAASRSAPQILEYHSGTRGGSLFRENTMLIKPTSEQTTAQ